MTRDSSGAALETLIVPRTRDLGDGFAVRPTQRRMGGLSYSSTKWVRRCCAAAGLSTFRRIRISASPRSLICSMEKSCTATAWVMCSRSGAVNWMIAGSGIVHSECTPPELRAARESRLFGIQTWVALPKSREEAEPGFAHHGQNALPMIEGEGKRVRLIAGSLYGARAPVEVFSDMFYADAALSDAARLELSAEHEERAIYLAEGHIKIAGDGFDAGRLLVIQGGAAVVVEALGAARLMLFGAEPMDGQRHVWWNFVSSSVERIEQAKAD